MSLSKEENKVVIDGLTRYGGLNQPNHKFIKVNVDCWEYIFDLLSLCDILRMSQTCQRMHQICGHYFRENFHGKCCFLSEKRKLRFGRITHEHDDFFRFVDTLNCHNLDDLRSISSMGLLCSLTTLNLGMMKLNEQNLHGFDNIQAGIESVRLSFCDINGNSVSEFLASCPKLKYLRICRPKFNPPASETNLFQCTYPMLEHFSYSGHRDQLMPFLKRNPSIKYLTIDENFLELDLSGIQLDYLCLVRSSSHPSNGMIERLKELHKNGVFKKIRLLLNIDAADAELVLNEMVSFGAPEILATHRGSLRSMSRLVQLKELHLWNIEDRNSDILETIARNLINLERLLIIGTVEHLEPFVRHSKSLKFILFDYMDESDLDLTKLNRVRQMSGMQQTIQIGVFNVEKYLATKWRADNWGCNLVKIRRVHPILEHFALFYSK